MLEDLLFQINKLHSKDLADLTVKLEEFSQIEKIITLKENISLLEKLPCPRTNEDDTELKNALEDYYQSLIYGGVTEKIRAVIFLIANIDKKIKEHLHYNKCANNKDENVSEITSEEMSTAWQNLIPPENLPGIYAKVAMLAKIFKDHLFTQDCEIKKLMFLETQIKLVYKTDVAPKLQDKRTEIIKQRDKELEKFPSEESLIARHDGTKRLRMYMESVLNKNIKELESIPDTTIVLFDTFNLTLDNNELQRLEAEKSRLEKEEEKHRIRLQMEIVAGTNVLDKHDRVIAEQELSLRAIKIINARANEAIEQLDTTLADKTATLEFKFKAALAKKTKERDDNILERAKALHAPIVPLNLEDIPGSIFARNRASSDGVSPKSSLIRNLSLTKFLTGSVISPPSPPTRSRTSSPGFVSPHRSSSSLFGSANSNKSGGNSPKDPLVPPVKEEVVEKVNP